MRCRAREPGSTSSPSACAGCGGAPSCSRRSGTRWSRRRGRCPGEAAALFTRGVRPAISLGSPTGSCSPGAARGRRDRAAVARDQRARGRTTSVGYVPRSPSCRRSRAACRVLRRVRPAADARARRAPAADRRAERLRRGTARGLHALGAVHAVHRAVQRDRPAGHTIPVAMGEDGLPLACSSWPSRSARTRCCRCSRRWRRAPVGPAAPAGADARAAHLAPSRSRPERAHRQSSNRRRTRTRRPDP